MTNSTKIINLAVGQKGQDLNIDMSNNFLPTLIFIDYIISLQLYGVTDFLKMILLLEVEDIKN